MNKQQIEIVKQGLRCCADPMMKKCDRRTCPYRSVLECRMMVARDARSVIEQMEQEIDGLRADLPSGEEEPEARTPENLLDMSENARIERVIDKLRLMRRQFQPGSQKSGAILDAMFFLRLMQNRSIEAGDKESKQGRRWIPVDERKPEHHEMVILTGIEAINNKRVYAIKCWDVDRWRPDNSAPSIYWDYWHKLPEPPKEGG